MINIKATAAALLMLAPSCLLGPGAASVLPPTVLLLESPQNRGSGIVIANNWILTAVHLLPVATAGGRLCEIAIAHPTLDLALIRCPGVVATGLRMASSMPKLHDPLSAYGWWLAEQFQRTDGYQGAQPYEMSAEVIHGCSGGAVVNARGELVGVIATVTYTSTWNGTDGYAVPQIAEYTSLDESVRAWIRFITRE